MSVQDVLVGGGAVAVLMTLVQITPVKINPWSSIGKALKAACRSLGKGLNGDVIERLDRMETIQTQTREKLDAHIRIDDERNADMHRARILQFNTELLKDGKHTEEDFNEILYNIDCY